LCGVVEVGVVGGDEVLIEGSLGPGPADEVEEVGGILPLQNTTTMRLEQFDGL
jgi:hypothetical protein